MHQFFVLLNLHSSCVRDNPKSDREQRTNEVGSPRLLRGRHARGLEGSLDDQVDASNEIETAQQLLTAYVNANPKKSTPFWHRRTFQKRHKMMTHDQSKDKDDSISPSKNPHNSSSYHNHNQPVTIGFNYNFHQLLLATGPWSAVSPDASSRSRWAKNTCHQARAWTSDDPPCTVSPRWFPPGCGRVKGSFLAWVTWS